VAIRLVLHLLTIKPNAPQGGADKSKAPAPPMPGMGPKDPKVVAEQLKTSLDGIKESAAYLMKSDFVK
jgi:hypothetical protein